MILSPQLKDRTATPYAADRGKAAIPFSKDLPSAWEKVGGWLAARAIAPGTAIIRYLSTDMTRELDLDVGLTLPRFLPGSDGILMDVVPAGCYATLQYTGLYEGQGLDQANAVLLNWAEVQGIHWQTAHVGGRERWGARVEWYLTDPAANPDPEKYPRELTFLIAGNPTS